MTTETSSNPANGIGNAGGTPWTAPEIIAPAITLTADIAEWLDAVATGRWTWTRNTRCKYVDLKLDTRRGAYCILDRNGEQITFEQLRWQYPAPLPTPPEAS